ncbi:bifunctional 2',3'-cyclic-nucleotide 2'-phosphodiesterase/3'-nucleotidase [Neobacillus niacini]|uniref:bifunctional 2',3'-cyclic-nucleotide 2'-phosphodiesterase/3'-nucleotidase n=1 Tax=Neobacillus niacini TaxID=86668 RepID=UPI0028639703|nr:bifunctional 2',3'-cyclic-nucleotide 2'-phosphodiesterase/3'-nucleotidase [Neobacillus niacini]MDR6999473.1 2',3'-cyclic-nucleotide 2'-phosphodiesterase/3'-nucleotidase/5'-nucleotidase [Neobacillus niacini]
MKKKNFGRLSKLTVFALLLGTLTSPFASFTAKAADAGTAPVKLRLMETTDIHSNVMDYDYYKDAPVNNFGLDRTAVLVKQARAEERNAATHDTYEQNSMLFDAGDLIQGNPLADYVAKVHPLGPNDVHPVFKAMALLDYDAGIVGNHEFNYGLDYLNSVLQHAPFKAATGGVGRDGIVNANIYVDDHNSDPSDDQNYFTPYKIINKVVKDGDGKDQTIKVGVIGFAPPQIMNWDKDKLEGKVIAKDIVQTAKKFIPEMKAKGADLIVAIAHSGCDIAQKDQENAENAVYALSTVPGIDALLFGHAHVNFPGDAQFNGKDGIDNTKGTINNVPAMEAGFWGNNLGVMDLKLEKVEGKWKVTDSKAALRPVTTVQTPDQDVVNAVKTEHEATIEYVRGKIGTTTAPLYSYFAQVQDDPTIQIVNNAQTEYVKKWIESKNPELKDIPVLSAGAPFKAGGRSGPDYYTNIEAGDLSIKSANDLYLYPNTLKAVQVTGATVREWLEMAAGQFNTVDPNNGHPQDIINDAFPSYNFDVIDGVKYQIDITQKPRYDKNGVLINADSHRIVGLTMPDGTPVKDDQPFIVATNNYRTGGGGNFPGINGKEKIVVDSPDESRQVLMNYIQDQGTVNPSADGNWSIKPVNKTAQLTFKSSPSAKTYAEQSSTIKSIGKVTDSDGKVWGKYQFGKDVHVQLLGINDLHGQLDYKTTVSGKPVGGIEYLAGYLKEREALNPANTLMVQAGDAVGASRPVSALLQDEPTIRFLNELGFDVGTIGNHEFDEGVTEMKRLIYGGAHPKTVDKYGPFEGAAFPYVVANVVDDKTDELILPPYVIKEVDGVKIGFIGVVTTETPSIVTPSGVAGVHFTDETDAINKYAKELEGKGVKSIVVLAHDPGTSAADGSNPTGKVVDIAKAVYPEVDVIFGAHDHKYLNSTVNGKLLVQSYSYGTAFSDVDLTIDPVTQDIVKKQAEIVSTFQDDKHLDAKVKAELDAYQAYVAPITSEVVGQAAAPISRTANASGETALGNLIADGMKAATNTDFAFMNVGGIRDDIKKEGPITWGDLFAIQPFGNDIVTEKITGEQVRILLNQQFAADRNRIMQIAGLKYTWSNNLPIGRKVLDIYLPNGKKIDPKGVYSVTVNNFMADGGDGFTILKQGTDRVTWMSDLDAFVNYVKSFDEKPISAQIEGRILIDTVAPDAPKVDEVTDQSTKVTGTTEEDAKVEVKAGGQVIGTATAKADGSFTVDIPHLKAGTEVSVTATDAAGNTSSETKVVVKDVTAPDAPDIGQIIAPAKSVTGKAEAGSTVKVFKEKTLLGMAAADKNGVFYIPFKSAQTHDTVLSFTATDAVGNTSKETNVKLVKSNPKFQ